MAEIPVDRADAIDRSPTMPLWTALLGLTMLIILVWLLFMLGADGANTDSQTAELRLNTATFAA